MVKTKNMPNESATLPLAPPQNIQDLVAYITIIIIIIGFVRWCWGIRKNNVYLKETFLYKKSKDLNQSDFGIYPIDAYTKRESDEEITRLLGASKNILIIGMPKAGKTRSAYEGIKSALPNFYVIKVPAVVDPNLTLPWMKRDYVLFFDDLNKFSSIEFPFSNFVNKFNDRSKKTTLISTCRTGKELDDFKSKSLDFYRRFNIIDLNEHELSEIQCLELAKAVNVAWKPDMFNSGFQTTRLRRPRR
jgi:hypothetical protein